MHNFLSFPFLPSSHKEKKNKETKKQKNKKTKKKKKQKTCTIFFGGAQGLLKKKRKGNRVAKSKKREALGGARTRDH